MKEILKKLNRIGRKYDVNRFYSIRIDPDGIILQGKFDFEIATYLHGIKGIRIETKKAFTYYTKSNVIVILTT